MFLYQVALTLAGAYIVLMNALYWEDIYDTVGADDSRNPARVSPDPFRLFLVAFVIGMCVLAYIQRFLPVWLRDITGIRIGDVVERREMNNTVACLRKELEALYLTQLKQVKAAHDKLAADLNQQLHHERLAVRNARTREQQSEIGFRTKVRDLNKRICNLETDLLVTDHLLVGYRNETSANVALATSSLKQKIVVLKQNNGVLLEEKSSYEARLAEADENALKQAQLVSRYVSEMARVEGEQMALREQAWKHAEELEALAQATQAAEATLATKTRRSKQQALQILAQEAETTALASEVSELKKKGTEDASKILEQNIQISQLQDELQILKAGKEDTISSVPIEGPTSLYMSAAEKDAIWKRPVLTAPTPTPPTAELEGPSQVTEMVSSLAGISLVGPTPSAVLSPVDSPLPDAAVTLPTPSFLGYRDPIRLYKRDTRKRVVEYHLCLFDEQDDEPLLPMESDYIATIDRISFGGPHGLQIADLIEPFRQLSIHPSADEFLEEIRTQIDLEDQNAVMEDVKAPTVEMAPVEQRNMQIITDVPEAGFTGLQHPSDEELTMSEATESIVAPLTSSWMIPTVTLVSEASAEVEMSWSIDPSWDSMMPSLDMGEDDMAATQHQEGEQIAESTDVGTVSTTAPDVEMQQTGQEDDPELMDDWLTRMFGAPTTVEEVLQATFPSVSTPSPLSSRSATPSPPATPPAPTVTSAAPILAVPTPTATPSTSSPAPPAVGTAPLYSPFSVQVRQGVRETPRPRESPYARSLRLRDMVSQQESPYATRASEAESPSTPFSQSSPSASPLYTPSRPSPLYTPSRPSPTPAPSASGASARPMSSFASPTNTPPPAPPREVAILHPELLRSSPRNSLSQLAKDHDLCFAGASKKQRRKVAPSASAAGSNTRSAPSDFDDVASAEPENEHKRKKPVVDSRPIKADETSGEEESDLPLMAQMEMAQKQSAATGNILIDGKFNTEMAILMIKRWMGRDIDLPKEAKWTRKPEPVASSILYWCFNNDILPYEEFADHMKHLEWTLGWMQTQGDEAIAETFENVVMEATSRHDEDRMYEKALEIKACNWEKASKLEEISRLVAWADGVIKLWTQVHP